MQPKLESTKNNRSQGRVNSWTFVPGLWRVFGLIFLLELTSCDTWPPHKLKVPPVTDQAYREYKLNIDDKKNITQPACVVIDGQDIQLPLNSGNSRPQENR